MQDVIMIGGGHLLLKSEVKSILRFATGEGSTAVRRLVDRVRRRFLEKGEPPYVIDVTGHLTRRSAIITNSGDIYLTFLSPSALRRRMSL